MLESVLQVRLPLDNRYSIWQTDCDPDRYLVSKWLVSLPNHACFTLSSRVGIATP